MRNTLKTFGVFALVLFNPGVKAVDLENGKELYEANCTRCHDTSVYTRSNRIATNFEKLRARVSQCELMLELAWFDDEVDDVTAYLNENYYKYNLSK